MERPARDGPRLRAGRGSRSLPVAVGLSRVSVEERGRGVEMQCARPGDVDAGDGAVDFQRARGRIQVVRDQARIADPDLTGLEIDDTELQAARVESQEVGPGALCHRSDGARATVVLLPGDGWDEIDRRRLDLNVVDVDQRVVRDGRGAELDRKDTGIAGDRPLTAAGIRRQVDDVRVWKRRIDRDRHLARHRQRSVRDDTGLRALFGDRVVGQGAIVPLVAGLRSVGGARMVDDRVGIATVRAIVVLGDDAAELVAGGVARTWVAGGVEALADDVRENLAAVDHLRGIGLRVVLDIAQVDVPRRKAVDI